MLCIVCDVIKQYLMTTLGATSSEVEYLSQASTSL